MAKKLKTEIVNETAPVEIVAAKTARKKKDNAELPLLPYVTQTTEVAAPEPVAVALAPKRRRPNTNATLADVFSGYIKHLDERGGSSGTIASYRMELDLAGKALGVETPISTMNETMVAAFFESDPVTRKRNGKQKSPLSVDKTRRVLRQALVWAGHSDLVPTAVAP